MGMNLFYYPKFVQSARLRVDNVITSFVLVYFLFHAAIFFFLSFFFQLPICIDYRAFLVSTSLSSSPGQSIASFEVGVYYQDYAWPLDV